MLNRSLASCVLALNSSDVLTKTSTVAGVIGMFDVWYAGTFGVLLLGRSGYVSA